MIKEISRTCKERMGRLVSQRMTLKSLELIKGIKYI